MKQKHISGSLTKMSLVIELLLANCSYTVRDVFGITEVSVCVRHTGRTAAEKGVKLKILVKKTPVSYIRLRIKKKHVCTKKFYFIYPCSVQKLGSKENDICFMLSGEYFQRMQKNTLHCF